MSHAMLTGLLIALAVICRYDCAPGQPDSPDKAAGNLQENIHSKHEVQRQDGNAKVGLCWLCVRTINQVMALARHEIRKEIKLMCHKFKHYQKNCKKQAYKYEAMAIHLLFHGDNAKDSCVHLHFC